MNTPWRVQMFGDLCLTRSGLVISRFKRQQAAVLLARLAYYPGKTHTRDELTEILWPDTDPVNGRPKLRVALNSLRRQLEPGDGSNQEVVIATHGTVQINPRAVYTDVAEFDDALRSARTATCADEKTAHIEHALTLYRGDLLPRFDDEWVNVERSNLQARMFGALDQYVNILSEARELPRAVPLLQHALRLDAYREETHCALIRAYAEAGQHSVARRQYQLLEKLLQEEMGIEPSEATRRLASVRVEPPTVFPREGALGHRRRPTISSSIGTAHRERQVAPKASSEVETAQFAPWRPTVVARIPVRFTRFFGREDEIQRLAPILTPPGPGTGVRERMVTLTGPAGVGKTRLAAEICDKMRGAYHEAVWFVTLDRASSPSEIPNQIARGLFDLRPSDGDATPRIAAFLAKQPSLMVLDGFDHLAGRGAGIVQYLMQKVPGLVILLTARHRLTVPGEIEFRVAPLMSPDENDDVHTMMHYASVKLFVDRAQSADADFRLSVRNAAAVATICRHLEGLPGNIELAAARAAVITPARMARSFSEGTDRFRLLAARRTTTDWSYPSIWTAISWSYEMLQPDVQRFFARLAIFREPWLEEEAAYVCDEPHALDYLDRLRSYSLVNAEPNGEEMEFRMLETIRAFAEAHLDSDEASELAQRRLRYVRTRYECVA